MMWCGVVVLQKRERPVWDFVSDGGEDEGMG